MKVIFGSTVQVEKYRLSALLEYHCSHTMLKLQYKMFTNKFKGKIMVLYESKLLFHVYQTGREGPIEIFSHAKKFTTKQLCTSFFFFSSSNL